MLRAYKYRIYPTDEQKVLFAKTFGCARVVYNWALDIKSNLYKDSQENISRFALQSKLRDELKQEKPWLKETNSQSLQYALLQLDNAFKNFFQKNGKYPNFKSKHDRQSFHNPQHCSVNFKQGVLNIPKAKNIKAVFHRTFKGNKIHDVTISKSYSLALRNEIRLKYLRNSWQDGVDELIEKEYARRYFTTISIVVVFLLLFAAVTYLAILCVKNDVPLL